MFGCMASSSIMSHEVEGGKWGEVVGRRDMVFFENFENRYIAVDQVSF